MNTDAPWPEAEEARARVLKIQTKLHQWASGDPHHRFRDLFNLVSDPAVLASAWQRVRGNRRRRSAGVDSQTAYSVAARGADVFLAELRADLKARRFEPLPVRERMIPKPGTSKRQRLGIPTVRDRVVQAGLKLVPEPIEWARESWRLQSLGELESWQEDKAGIQRSFGSGRCGW